ncbi:MAG: MBOAT family protein [Candidatus Omnitrophica bacterium]|nr:MBOAT family protein [Candidatus Omnitrophota bacterium]
MLFNSFQFVFFFLIVYSIYVILNRKWQNGLLLVASYVFYGWWDWRFLSLIAVSTVIDYVLALQIDQRDKESQRKFFLILSCIANLGLLGFFKYFNFFTESAVEIIRWMGFTPDPVTLNIVLPVGISFYTFQTMSYTIDVYRGHLKPTRNFLDYSVYVSFFPQLVAGPIERATHFLPQVQNERTITYQRIREGAWLILLGYFKKLVIADNLADIVNPVFNDPSAHHGLTIVIAIYAFAFQIYGDFSGYSDIAIGTSRLFGFDLMRNFAFPYFSRDIAEFWRRWHISLSTWLRDYLYISLGGNKDGPLKTYRNLFLTMLLGGLWHGAAWNFVLWGIYQGGLLIFHRLIFGRSKEPEKVHLGRRIVNIAIMFQFVCVGWLLFRVNSMADLSVLIQNLFAWETIPWIWVGYMAVVLTPLLLLQLNKEVSGDLLHIKKWRPSARLAVYLILLAYIALFGKVDGGEFIYFQF